MKYLITFAVALLPATALAGKVEAETCAASLSPPAKQIYDATAPNVTATSNLRQLVTEETRALVRSGKVSRADARANARAAGQCLQQLKT